MAKTTKKAKGAVVIPSVTSTVNEEPKEVVQEEVAPVVIEEVKQEPEEVKEVIIEQPTKKVDKRIITKEHSG